MLRIHTVDGKYHRTDNLTYADALTQLRDPDHVFDIVATTVADGGRGSDPKRMAIPVRNVVKLDEVSQ